MTKKELKRKLNIIVDQLDFVSTDMARTNCDNKFVNGEKIRDWFDKIYTATNDIVRIVKDEI